MLRALARYLVVIVLLLVAAIATRAISQPKGLPQPEPAPSPQPGLLYRFALTGSIYPADGWWDLALVLS